MDKIKITNQAKLHKESQIINYYKIFNRMNRRSFNNDDISEFISNYKSINDNNSSINLEEKPKKLKPIKFSQHRGVEMKIQKLNDTPHFFYNKYIEEKTNINSSILQLSANLEENNNITA